MSESTEKFIRCRKLATEILPQLPKHFKQGNREFHLQIYNKGKTVCAEYHLAGEVVSGLSSTAPLPDYLGACSQLLKQYQNFIS